MIQRNAAARAAPRPSVEADLIPAEREFRSNSKTRYGALQFAPKSARVSCRAEPGDLLAAAAQRVGIAGFAKVMLDQDRFESPPAGRPHPTLSWAASQGPAESPTPAAKRAIVGRVNDLSDDDFWSVTRLVGFASGRHARIGPTGRLEWLVWREGVGPAEGRIQASRTNRICSPRRAPG
jgi:hypothetical protein